MIERGTITDEMIDKASDAFLKTRQTAHPFGRNRMLKALEAVAPLIRNERFGYKIGDRVSKIKGSSWNGRVVGFYSTELTPEGICIESELEPGSVQIYPCAAVGLVARVLKEPTP